MADPKPTADDALVAALRPKDEVVPQPKRPDRRPRYVLAVASVALVGVATLAWAWWPRSRSHEAEALAARVDENGTEAVERATADRLAPQPMGKPTSDPCEEMDPRLDGWESEAFSEEVEAQLKTLGKLIADPKYRTGEAAEGLVTEAFRAQALRPEALEQAYADEVFVVRRPPSDQVALPSPEKYRGPAGLIEAVAALAVPYLGASDVRVKFKVVGVELADDEAAVELYYEAAGRKDNQASQQTATWQSRWTRDEDAPRLLWLGLEDYEEVVTVQAAGELFVEGTEAVLGGNASYRDQLRYGIDHWRARIQAQFGVPRTGHHGVAIGDVNGDGLDDVYFCQPGGMPNKLYVQNADGTATDLSSEAGVDWMEMTGASLIVDLDNDGHQDLIVGTYAGLLFMRGDATGRFELKSMWPTSDEYQGLAAADYDNDGFLDVFACGYSHRGIFGFVSPMPFHDAQNGGPNVLLRNDGDWNFSDVTADTGLDAHNRRWSYAASWEDFDNDGDLDLYVVNDFGPNNLYRNDGGRFVDVSYQLGAEDLAQGMSVSWSDFNGDGRMDIYVGNMFSSAGTRITFQEKFKDGVADATKAIFQRHARGNTLLEARPDGTFEDVSVEAGVTMGRWSWGSKFIDLNNNGLDDLLIANGYITQESTGDL